MDPAEFEKTFDADHDEAPAEAPRGFRDIRTRALIAQIALAINPLLYLVVLGIGVADVITSAASGAPTMLGDDFAAAANVVELVVRFGTAVAFIAWLHGASTNSYLLAEEAPEHGPSLAIGAWFIPCVSFWLPYQVVSEIDRRSDPERLGHTSGIVMAWWAAWVATLLLLYVAAVTEGAIAGLVWLALVALQVASATLAILVIRRIQKNQIALSTRADAHAIAAQFA
ncbi:DUF4328 domain-containing protein [Sandaracinus amylolyticus]|uniref:DUF4328 domain-containing protein n=1 Tax=Sandaracinus amylolyticus TaxID=927083 RepID=UPI001F2D7D5A|nr:DUF4328 domain-containing protein [Sandaracinus amylolyticus]UJR85457.1 Hypothetical protein I5071_75370 [Sandaracinus amylolyticus]